MGGGEDTSLWLTAFDEWAGLGFHVNTRTFTPSTSCTCCLLLPSDSVRLVLKRFCVRVVALNALLFCVRACVCISDGGKPVSHVTEAANVDQPLIRCLPI